MYDRYHKTRVQKKWSLFVSHLAREPLPNDMMPRKITIVLAGPPGDGLRPAREHFHEYVKPILVAGAVDWEVIEGRREGEVRAGLAEKIRKLRRQSGERVAGGAEEEEQDLVRETRQNLGVSDWNGVRGDLILGRHTWKEYVRGLHEGWLGPLEPPQQPEPLKTAPEALADSPPSSPSDQPAETESSQADSQTATSPQTEVEKPPEKPLKPPTPPPYISTSSYTTVPTPSTLPDTLQPSLPLQLPHLLGLKHTPTRLYRFLTRRHLADDTGAQVAALVLCTHSRPYTSTTSFASATDPDSSALQPDPAADNVIAASEAWEQEAILEDEEVGWHKSAWKEEEPKEGEARKERVWKENMVIDPRIGSRMRAFVLEEGANIRAEEQAEEMRQKEPSLLERARKYIGWEKQEKKGWDMGKEGDEFS